ncbi:MAG: BlaI/MecI/CopY family transcriptional regulator [Pirellulaceae bacterium]|nr:BlaI/MecI/CopY family transcriptional regulator [Planctomycetales bacterium]
MNPNDSGPLTAAQREIMEIVWLRGEVTVAEVRDELSGHRPVARNTVQTMMVRLEERGWLAHREDGRTFVYSAAKPRAASLGARVWQFVDRFFAGSPEQMVNALLEYRGLSDDEADRIRTMISAAEHEPRQVPQDAPRKSSKKRSRRR